MDPRSTDHDSDNESIELTPSEASIYEVIVESGLLFDEFITTYSSPNATQTSTPDSQSSTRQTSQQHQDTSDFSTFAISEIEFSSEEDEWESVSEDEDEDEDEDRDRDRDEIATLLSAYTSILESHHMAMLDMISSPIWTTPGEFDFEIEIEVLDEEDQWQEARDFEDYDPPPPYSPSDLPPYLEQLPPPPPYSEHLDELPQLMGRLSV